MPFGMQAPDETTNVAGTGSAAALKGSLRRFRASQPGTVSGQSLRGGVPRVPTITLFGQAVDGLVSVTQDAPGASGYTTTLLEWVVEVGQRLWIVRASDSELTADPSSMASAAFATRLNALTIASANVNQPTSVGVTGQVSPAAAGAPKHKPVSPQSSSGGAITPFSSRTVASTPSWWSGTCDIGRHSGSYVMNTWQGLTACGPRPDLGYAQVNEWFPGGSLAESEWQCAELSKRWLYQEYGQMNYAANGNQMLSHYPGGPLAVVYNGSALPTPGDILAMGSSSQFGHTAVVTSVTATTVSWIEQNSTPNGSYSATISGGVVGGDAYNSDNIIGWLHDPHGIAQTPPPPGALQMTTAVRANGWNNDLFSRGTNGDLWHAVSDPNGTTSAWEDLGGTLGGEPGASWNASNTQLDVYVVSTDTTIWHRSYTASNGQWNPWQLMDGGGHAHQGSTMNVTTSREPGNDYQFLLIEGSDGGGWIEGLYNDGKNLIFPWQSLGGHILGAPSGNYNSSNTELDIYAIGSDHQIYEDTSTNSWTGFRLIGGGGHSGTAENEMVTMTRQSNNNIDLLIRGTDGAAWHGATTNPLTTSWTPMYGTVKGAPNGARDGASLTTYAVGPDFLLYRNKFPNPFTPWTAVPGGPVA